MLRVSKRCGNGEKNTKLSLKSVKPDSGVNRETPQTSEMKGDHIT
jgi:hypothetical protein